MIQDPTRTSFELLLNISRELAASLDLPRVLERVLSLSTESVGAERGSLIVLNPDGQPLAAAIVIKGQLHRPSTSETAEILDHGLACWLWYTPSRTSSPSSTCSWRRPSPAWLVWRCATPTCSPRNRRHSGAIASCSRIVSTRFC